MSTTTTQELRLFRSYRLGAHTRNYEWALNFEQFCEKISQACHYCGIEPYRGLGGNALPCNGIDRKDNTVGYTDENSLPCCSSCNLLKGTMPYSHFLARIHCIAARLPLPSFDEVVEDCKVNALQSPDLSLSDVIVAQVKDRSYARVERLSADPVIPVRSHGATAALRLERMATLDEMRTQSADMTPQERAALASQLRQDGYTVREIRYAVRASTVRAMQWANGEAPD